ncbi:MAG: OmpA family protein, partial [Bacteroidota bacterium]
MKKEELVIKENVNPNFNLTLKKGNHYTLLIRKEGYMTKRLEAYVNINGCILCFDGIGDVRPAVTDNLTEGNEMGTLLANIELDPVSVGKSFQLRNIYYSYNKAEIRPDAAQELDKLIIVLRDNPGIVIELGSHTDSRGDEDYNLNLSTERAKAAVDYLVANGGIDKDRITYRGYGETELKNKCTSFVDCTEEQHAVNRRTELKVLDIRPYKQNELKSLAVLKEEEEFQRMLEEIQNQGQVQIGEGQEAPKLYKEGEPIIEDESQASEDTAVEGDQVLIEETFENQTEPVSEEAKDKLEAAQNVGNESLDKVEEVTEEIKETVETTNETTSEIQAASDKAQDVFESTTTTSDNGFIPTEDAIVGPVNLIPAGYNGYKIQIGSFSKPLAVNNPVMVRHGNLWVDR